MVEFRTVFTRSTNLEPRRTIPATLPSSFLRLISSASLMAILRYRRMTQLECVAESSLLRDPPAAVASPPDDDIRLAKKPLQHYLEFEGQLSCRRSIVSLRHHISTKIETSLTVCCISNPNQTSETRCTAWSRATS